MRKLLAAIVVAMWGGLATAEEIVIAALGDSLTHGYGLPVEQGFVPQMQAWLRGQGAEVTLINAGVSGDTTAGGLARLGWTLTPEVDALIVALGGNDALRGIAPEDARANLTQILETASENELPVLLVGIRAPGNFGPDYKAEFEAIFPDLAQVHGAIYVPDFLAALGRDPAGYAPFLQADGLHPNADGVALVVKDLGPSVQALIKAVQTP